MEVKTAPKNWFCTLTFRPASRQRLFMEDNNGVPQLRSASSRHTRAMSEITLWLKRMRSALSARDASAMSLRFFAVTEEHQDGTPHIHVLIHCGNELKKSVITAAKWPHGFWSAKLVDEEASGYLTKYITKEHHRVRASIKYGNADAQSSGQVTKTSEAQSEGKQPRPFGTAQHSIKEGSFAGAEVVSTPEAMLKAMVYNGELRVEDSVSLLSTLIDLRSEQDGGTTVPTRPERARKGDKRLGEKAPARRSECSNSEPAQDRPAQSAKDNRLRPRQDKKPDSDDGKA